MEILLKQKKKGSIPEDTQISTVRGPEQLAFTDLALSMGVGLINFQNTFPPYQLSDPVMF